jgi:hypothetical protein
MPPIGQSAFARDNIGDANADGTGCQVARDLMARDIAVRPSIRLLISPKISVADPELPHSPSNE